MLIGCVDRVCWYLIPHGYSIIYIQTHLTTLSHRFTIAPCVALAPHHIHLPLPLVVTDLAVVANHGQGLRLDISFAAEHRGRLDKKGDRNTMSW